MLTISILEIEYSDAGGRRRNHHNNDNPPVVTQSPNPSPPDWSSPEVGEFCPPYFHNDGANCSWSGTPIPAGTRAFVYAGNFYYTSIPGSTNCPFPGIFHDGANCFVRPVPTDYTPFIYDNRFYVAKNNVFTKKFVDCPINGVLHGNYCLMGKLPWHGTHRREGLVRYGYFAVIVAESESCEIFKGGSQKKSFTQEITTRGRPNRLLSVKKYYCELAKIPTGYVGQVKDDNFVVGAKPNPNGRWYIERKNMTGIDALPRPVGGLADESPAGSWTLTWSDEFNSDHIGNQDKCFRSNARAHCTEWFYWREGVCHQSPLDWTHVGQASWTSDQHDRFDGIRDLNKCQWKIADAFDFWSIRRNSDGSMLTPESERVSGYSPRNVKVANGVVQLKSSEVVKSHYDCGRILDGTDIPSMNNYSSDCPLQGAFIWTPSGDPWNNGNSETHANPEKRYIGKTLGYGKIEVRANIVRAGRLAWPSIWLWGDRKTSEYGQNNTGEIDILEFIGKDHWLAGTSTVQNPDTYFEEEVLRQAPTHGWAYQTLHNWTEFDETDADPANDQDHPAQAQLLPISMGEWHVYGVEYEPSEIRFYIDGVLRHRVVDGQALESGRIFRIPRDQEYHIILGTGARPSRRWQTWYKNWQEGRAAEADRPNDFSATEFHVDYVRYYQRSQ